MLLIFFLFFIFSCSPEARYFKSVFNPTHGPLLTILFSLSGLWKAVREVFPAVSLKGCVFHFIQTTYTGSGVPLQTDADGPAIPIRGRFNRLNDRATSPELQSIVRYVEKTWFNNGVWRPRN